MILFADCQTPDPAPLTPQEICDGFAKCGQPGLRVNATNLNRVIRWLESQLGTGGPVISTHTVISTSVNPLTAIEGSQFCFTITLDSNVATLPLDVPVSSPNYFVGPVLTIPVGQSSGTVCITTNDNEDADPDIILSFTFGTNPRLIGFTGSTVTAIVTDDDGGAPTAPIPPLGAPFTNTGLQGTVI